MINTDDIQFIKPHLLQVKGCIDTNRFYSKTYKDLISERTNITIESDSDFKLNFPYLKEILDRFNIANIDDFNSITLNELGEIIAENYINAQGGLN